jgi:DNA-binding response OmpR family regulator
MTILFVEDQSSFSDLVARTIHHVHFEVVQTLAAAKEYLATNRPDMVLLDLGLPDSTGLDTLRALGDCTVPKVVITGHRLAEEIAAMGVLDYIHKGDFAEVAARIRFNIAKVSKKARFSPGTFEAIKACIEADRLVAV